MKDSTDYILTETYKEFKTYYKYYIPKFSDLNYLNLYKDDKLTDILKETLRNNKNLLVSVNNEIDNFRFQGNTDLEKRYIKKAKKIKESIKILKILLKPTLYNNKRDDFINILYLDNNNKNNIKYIDKDSIMSGIVSLFKNTDFLTDIDENSNTKSYIWYNAFKSFTNNIKDEKSIDYLSKSLDKIESNNTNGVSVFNLDFHIANFLDFLDESIKFKSKKINKVIKDLISSEGKFSDQDIEYTGESIKQVIIRNLDKNEKNIKEVEGDLINYFYQEDNYDLTDDSGRSSVGSLGISCMRQPEKNYKMNLYSNNPGKVSMAVKLKGKKTRARCILWKYNGSIYYDRIYYVVNKDKEDLLSYLNNKGYKNIYSGNGLETSKDILIIPIKYQEERPYLDSMKSIGLCKFYNNNNLFTIYIKKENEGSLLYNDYYRTNLYLPEKSNKIKEKIKLFSKNIECIKIDGVLGLSSIEKNTDELNLLKENTYNKQYKSVLSTDYVFFINKYKLSDLLRKKFNYLEPKNNRPYSCKHIYYNPLKNTITSTNLNIKSLLIDLNNTYKDILINTLSFTNLNKKDGYYKLYPFYINEKDFNNIKKDIIYSEKYNNYIYKPSFIYYNNDYYTKREYDKIKITTSKEFEYILSKALNKNEYKFNLSNLKFKDLYKKGYILFLYKQKVKFTDFFGIYSSNKISETKIEYITEGIKNLPSSIQNILNRVNLKKIESKYLYNIKRKGNKILIGELRSSNATKISIYLDMNIIYSKRNSIIEKL